MTAEQLKLKWVCDGSVTPPENVPECRSSLFIWGRGGEVKTSVISSRLIKEVYYEIKGGLSVCCSSGGMLSKDKHEN